MTDHLPDDEGDQQFESLKLLIMIGDKYGVEDLVDQCAKMLRQLLTTQRFCRIFGLADQLHHRTLKHTCLHFVRRDQDALAAVHDCKDFDVMDPQLIRELYLFVHKLGKRKQGVTYEFPDSSNWNFLSYAQLQRACDERGLTNLGDRAILLAQLSDPSVRKRPRGDDHV